jgi:23S rRNA pseudouridine1911/1915/1917 synthase
MPHVETEFLVPAADARRTLAAVLRRHLPGRSWNQVRRLVYSGRVVLNGEVWRDPARRLQRGDKVCVLLEPQPPAVGAESVPIVYCDEHLAVVEKPSGIRSQRHRSERRWRWSRRLLVPTMEELTALAIARREGSRRAEPVYTVHRLDKDASGLLVLARTPEAAQALVGQFARHQVHRLYRAIVHGKPSPGTITTYLVRDRGDGLRGSCGTPGVGKRAVTHIVGVEVLGEASLATCRLETGRTHQLRIHLSEAGHPVYGDTVYGPESGSMSTGVPRTRLALHAAELGFAHPLTGQWHLWTSPLPGELVALVDALRRRG